MVKLQRASYQIRAHLRDLDEAPEGEAPDESSRKAPTIDEVTDAVRDALADFGFAVSVTAERLDI